MTFLLENIYGGYEQHHHKIRHHKKREHIFFTKTPIRGLLHILILKILKESQIHGGEIYRQLKDKYDVDAPKPIIYGVLRRMEKLGFLTSKWDIEEGGPAKRIYLITEEGLDYLEWAIENLKKIKEIIDKLIK